MTGNRETTICWTASRDSSEFQQMLAIEFFGQRVFIGPDKGCVVSGETTSIGIDACKVDKVILALDVPDHTITHTVTTSNSCRSMQGNFLQHESLSPEFACDGFFEDKSCPYLKIFLVEQLSSNSSREIDSTM